VDGLYLMLLGMWGIVGLVCFLVLIAKAIRCQRECFRTSRNKTQRSLAVGLFAGTFGLLANGITLDTFFSSKVAFAYWFLMGLLLAGRRLENEAVAKDVWLPTTVRGMVPLSYNL
jgi:O-antigen ligase